MTDLRLEFHLQEDLGILARKEEIRRDLDNGNLTPLLRQLMDTQSPDEFMDILEADLERHKSIPS